MSEEQRDVKGCMRLRDSTPETILNHNPCHSVLVYSPLLAVSPPGTGPKNLFAVVPRRPEGCVLVPPPFVRATVRVSRAKQHQLACEATGFRV